MIEIVIGDRLDRYNTSSMLVSNQFNIDLKPCLYDWLYENAFGNWSVYCTVEHRHDPHLRTSFFWFLTVVIKFEKDSDAILFKLSCM
jgi:hypothetical protein